jgi:glutathione S-transferase
MTLALYYHPLASFCHKVLIALYESGAPFEARMVDFGNEEASAAFLALWPVGKIPVLRDEARDRTIPETSIIIEYLVQHAPGAAPLIPADPDLAREARLWDRFFDLYVSVPMQKIVIDTFRPAGANDPRGVAEARSMLAMAYGMIERQMAGRTWAAGESFTMADCSAAPALFYSRTLVPFGGSHPNTAAYFERLVERPSFARTLKEAQPYFKNYPFSDAVERRFKVA